MIFLILFPLLIGALLLGIRGNFLRGLTVKSAAGVLAAASVYLVVKKLKGKADYFTLDFEEIDNVILVLDIAISLLMIYLGIKYKKYLVPFLVVLQAGMMLWFEITHGHEIEVEHQLYVDKFTLIMVLIIGIIGSLICFYALGYMKDYHHHHREIKDRRYFFFFLMFVFLSAMFGIVFSNNMVWLYFFWEITTLCSFFMIGYSKSEQAIANSFKALTMNLLGGLAFAGAIVYMGVYMEILELDKLVSLQGGSAIGIAIIPATLLGFAGITKAAQMPFSTWLLGAMVAPTPTSALLHSSTMVKAGVFLILRLAPLYGFNLGGGLLMVIGGTTFMFASFIAISQRNAKKVLAYSTVANLGLIVACGGIGTYEAVWAGILLIIFHAVAKSLLFLCVGTVEHNLGSRDIEEMDGLITRMPKIATLMVVGIAGMFLAPFGMLISKWAVLKAFIDSNNIVLVGMLVFGSAATLFFWTKWLGKLVAMVHTESSIEESVHKEEWMTLFLLAIMTIVVCFVFPFISKTAIEPYLDHVFTQGEIALNSSDIRVMTMMLGMVLVLPIGMLFQGKKEKIVPAYMAGRNTGDNVSFKGSMGKTVDLSLKNYYMEKYFGEKRLQFIAKVITVSFIIILFVFLIGGSI